MKAIRRLLRPFWNPIVEKELRSRMRTGRASLLISVYLVTLAAVGYFTYVVVRRQAAGGVVGGQLSVNAGSTIFRALTVWELILIVFVAPALTASAIAGERERQTLDLLLCTRVRPSTIVMGKLVASLLFAVLLLVASIPVFSMVFLFGGVELSQVAGVAVILGTSAMVIGAIGLLCSAALPRPTGATVSAYIIAFLYVVVPIGTSFTYPAWTTSTTVQQYAQVANPAFALGSTLLDTPVHSPTASAPASATTQPFVAPTPSPAFSGPFACAITPYGSSCSGSSSYSSSSPIARALPETDKIQAGLFRGWRAWQGFAVVSLLIVALAVGLSVAALSKRHIRVPGRRPLSLPLPEVPGG